MYVIAYPIVHTMDTTCIYDTRAPSPFFSNNIGWRKVCIGLSVFMVEKDALSLPIYKEISAHFLYFSLLVWYMTPHLCSDDTVMFIIIKAISRDWGRKEQ